MSQVESKEPRLSFWYPGKGATFRFSSFLFLRGLGFVYFFAFLCLWNDLLPLLGSEGLLPSEAYMERVYEHFGDRSDAFWEIPTLFHIHISDGFMQGCAFVGMILSLCLFLGLSNAPLLFALWALYFSFVSVGQRWYSFGWEFQLLETGFLALFLAPLLHPTKRIEAPKATIYLSWWLAARLMWGAGLIKIRGDACWTDLTCLEYHFETQPVPNFLSPFFHSLPSWMLKLGVLCNHFVELLLPFALLGTSRIRNAAGVIFIVFQLTLILSGNLSFLNWLSILPFFLCIDDNVWRRLKPKRWNPTFTANRPTRLASYLYTPLVMYLSLPIAANLLSENQAMNQTYDPFRLVNTYGAFGSVGRTRPEIILEGLSADGVWKEYEFKCKPGSVDRRPCWISPYHYRLDWLIWFTAMTAERDGSVGRDSWFIHFIWKLLHNDRLALSLLAGNPFSKAPPLAIRARVYQYRFGESDWWEREYSHTWIEAITKDTPELKRFIRSRNWDLDP